MNLPHLQIESLMHGMPYMWMQRENVRAFNDSGRYSIRIKCRILGDLGPDGPQILPGLAGPENFHARPYSRLMLAWE
jgi:hypothetical protein